MDPFVQRHRDKIAATLTCFDRVVITGTLPEIAHGEALARYLTQRDILLKDFPRWAEPYRKRLRHNAEQLADMQELARSIVYASKTIQDMRADLERLRRTTGDVATASWLYETQRQFQRDVAAELIDLVLEVHEPHFLAEVLEAQSRQNDAHYREMDAAVYERAIGRTDLEPMLSIQLNVNRELHHAIDNLVTSVRLFAQLARASEGETSTNGSQ